MRTPEEILRTAQTIAVVGASPDPSRTSHRVMLYLQRVGYRCIPVNPNAGEVLGERCYPSLADLPEPVDLVDVFRRAEYCADVAREAAAIGAPALWLQLGLRSAEAQDVADEAGMEYVEDACTAVVHRRL
ncbi:MAG: CoA-binding protein [Actinomycetota bacterium]|nr:CoA-binding protein [Actinomycetota bacterium]